jgi:5-guanidino-2-oxopentanoate decarboxylase
MNLLEGYGVDTVFEGAGFMADGYARSSGRPGVCTLITGPGVTNAATPLGQAYADSIPLLLISSANDSRTLGKGWGCLHEISDQRAVTAPLTAFSAVAGSPDEIPELIGQAFAVFASRRPRPVHISIPIDVLAMPVEERWKIRTPPVRPVPAADPVRAAAELLAMAERPMIAVGGGAVEAGTCVTELAERLGATVIASNAGKGIVADTHPLSLGGGMIREPVRDHLATADVILAIGTELSATDSFVPSLPINGKLIRVDIDPAKFNDCYPADIAVLGDAGAAVGAILAVLNESGPKPSAKSTRDILARVRGKVLDGLSATEKQHKAVLDQLRAVLPADTVIMGDISQIVYTGSAMMPVDRPRRWFYPAGFGTLGCALPCAIGAKLALPHAPVIALVGDGGFMFTVQELMTAVELKLALPVVIWNNDGFGMIRDGLEKWGIPRIAADPLNPDFIKLADAFGCEARQPRDGNELGAAVTKALATPGPTLIVVNQDSDWLTDGS